MNQQYKSLHTSTYIEKRVKKMHVVSLRFDNRIIDGQTLPMNLAQHTNASTYLHIYSVAYCFISL